MNRREFNRLAGIALATPQAMRAADAIRFDASTKSWFLANRYFERQLTFDPARGLITQHFIDRRTGHDWAARQSRWGSEIFLIVDDDVFYGVSPAERFHYVDHEISRNLLRVRLDLMAQKL